MPKNIKRAETAGPSSTLPNTQGLTKENHPCPPLEKRAEKSSEKGTSEGELAPLVMTMMVQLTSDELEGGGDTFVDPAAAAASTGVGGRGSGGDSGGDSRSTHIRPYWASIFSGVVGN
ncbi:hypothetical protein CRG98_012668 [Punica granatum]|uniref:Uncharacterized protein n=1 Tax=Punica granatum TaxID=22663 RepID=A0A2I0KEH1_PUNGR|nr:hypothetical protein CRG98_012668 [Punica granatum]